MSCFVRADKPIDEDSWLTQQLKLTRDQLDKKSRFCEQLARELKRLEADLGKRNEAARETRSLLRATNSELQAAALAGAVARAEHEEEATALRARAEAFQAGASASFAHSPRRSEARAVNEGAAARALAAAAQAAALAAERDAEALRIELARERELHDEAVRLLKAQRDWASAEVDEVQQEMKTLSTGLEQKEEEMLSIQFDMVSLQNRLKDQTQLVISNAEAFQTAAEELADKDELLTQALKRQEELLEQINSMSEQLQTKVAHLSQELEGSRAAHKALEEQTRGAVDRLETDRDALAAELKRARVEANAQLAALRKELQHREAAAEEQRSLLEEEHRRALAASEEEAARIQAELEEQLRNLMVALAAATERAAAADAEAGAAEAEATGWAQCQRQGRGGGRGAPGTCRSGDSRCRGSCRHWARGGAARRRRGAPCVGRGSGLRPDSGPRAQSLVREAGDRAGTGIQNLLGTPLGVRCGGLPRRRPPGKRDAIVATERRDCDEAGTWLLAAHRQRGRLRCLAWCLSQRGRGGRRGRRRSRVTERLDRSGAGPRPAGGHGDLACGTLADTF